jgi:lactose/L-arabinose transport system permease protein
MVMFLAGLQSIPEELYESAKLDGAGPLNIFWNITLPSLKPIIIFSMILSTNGTLNLFAEPYLLTGGGPNNTTLSIGVYIYRQAFQSFNITYSATISIAVVVIVAILAQFQLRFGREND